MHISLGQLITQFITHCQSSDFMPSAPPQTGCCPSLVIAKHPLLKLVPELQLLPEHPSIQVLLGLRQVPCVLTTKMHLLVEA
jgi:hypothetical protein